METKIEKGYAVIARDWKKGDQIELDLPMPIQRVYSNTSLSENTGRVALQRGPLMYCAEAIDNGGLTSNLSLPAATALSVEFKPELLNGVMVITGEIPVPKVNPEGTSISTNNQKFVAVPYYSWAHRGEGEMVVWFPEKIKAIELISR